MSCGALLLGAAALAAGWLCAVAQPGRLRDAANIRLRYVDDFDHIGLATKRERVWLELTAENYKALST